MLVIFRPGGGGSNDSLDNDVDVRTIAAPDESSVCTSQNSVAVASGYLSPIPTNSVPVRSSSRRRMKKNLDIPDDLSPRVFHPSVKLKRGTVF